MIANLPHSPEIARNADFKAGYAEAIRNAISVSMNMPLSEAGTEITERMSDTNVQAMAWRTSMAILKLLPTETTPDLGSVKDRFATELLALLSQYPAILFQGRAHDWGIGCGERLQSKLRELAKTDAEISAALEVAGVRYG